MDTMNVIETIGRSYDALGLLAAPKAFATRCQSTHADANLIRAVLENFLDVVGQMPDCTENVPLKTAAPYVKALLAQLPATLGEEVPPALIATARDILAILQCPTPPEGWDAYDP